MENNLYQIYEEHYANRHKSKCGCRTSPPPFFLLGKLPCSQSSTKHTRSETQPADEPAGRHM